MKSSLYSSPTPLHNSQHKVAMFMLYIPGSHVSHLEDTPEEELNRLLGIVVDVENLFMCVTKEEDADTKQVYFYLFKVTIATFCFNLHHFMFI